METTIKVLLLEDNATDADIVEMLLKKEMPKCEIKCIMHQHEYIEELNNFKPDIILADYALPQFTAIEALEILHQKKNSNTINSYFGRNFRRFCFVYYKIGCC